MRANKYLQSVKRRIVRSCAFLVPKTFSRVHHQEPARTSNEPRPGAVGMSHEAVRNVGNDLVVAVFVHGHETARLQCRVTEAGKWTIAVIATIRDSVPRQIGDDRKWTIFVMVPTARLSIEHTSFLHGR
jgi:hypothetical protein